MFNQSKKGTGEQSRWRGILTGFVIAVLSSFSTTEAMADRNVDASSVSFQGADLNNSGDFSSQTAINKSNVGKLQLKGVYVIPAAPAGLRSRSGEAAVGMGIAVSNNGIAFVPVTDGRIIKLDVQNMSGSTNADGTAIPVVLGTYDLVADSRYTGQSPTDGDDISTMRLHPTLINGNIYVGNYKEFLSFDQNGPNFQLMGTPTRFDVDSGKEQGAVLFSINANTGALNWKTVVNPNPSAMITLSPVVYKGVVYVGSASEMSGQIGVTPFWGYSAWPGVDPFLSAADDAAGKVERSGIMYRGALTAVDEKTGKVLFTTYMVPKQEYRTRAQIDADNALDLYMGASIWGGGTPVVDPKRNSIYVGTGEVYTSPLEADVCEQNRLSQVGANPRDASCLNIDQNGTVLAGPVQNVVEAAGVNSPNKPAVDAIVALDAKTGAVKWSTPMNGFDVWGFGCLAPIFAPAFPLEFMPTCPPYLRGQFFGLNFTDKDLDVAEMPILVKNVQMGNGEKRDLLIATTKGANIAALDPDNGSVVWKSDAPLGPGSLFGGGILWGSATDGKYFYTRSTTSDLTLADLNNPSKKVVANTCPASAFDPDTGYLSGGVYAAIDLKDGSLVWQRCLTAPLLDPATLLPKLDGQGHEIEAAGLTESGIAYANGLLYVPGPGTPYATGFFQERLQRPYMYIIDAKTGETVKRLPLNLDGQQATFSQKYARPTVKGDMLIFGNGERNSADQSGRDRRVIIYQLTQ